MVSYISRLKGGMKPGCVKFILFQTFGRVSLKSAEHALTKLPECGTRNYEYIQSIFEVKEGIFGIAGKR